MKYYKDSNNKVFAYEADGSQDSIIPQTYIRISLDEVKRLTKISTPVEQQELVVSPWQLRKALNRLGLRESIEALVKNTDNQDIKDGWEFASEWREFNPIVLAMAQAAGLSSQDINNIFKIALEN